MFDGIIKQINEWSEQIKNWVVSNSGNEYFWIGAFFIILLVFMLAYNALHRD